MKPKQVKAQKTDSEFKPTFTISQRNTIQQCLRPTSGVFIDNDCDGSVDFGVHVASNSIYLDGSNLNNGLPEYPTDLFFNDSLDIWDFILRAIGDSVSLLVRWTPISLV